MEQSNEPGTLALVSLKEADIANKEYKKELLRQEKESEQLGGSTNTPLGAVPPISKTTHLASHISAGPVQGTPSSSAELGKFIF